MKYKQRLKRGSLDNKKYMKSRCNARIVSVLSQTYEFSTMNTHEWVQDKIIKTS